MGALVTLAVALGPLVLLRDGGTLSLWEDIAAMLPAALFLSYALGIIPALAIGALDAVLAGRGLPTGRRLVCCTLAGAVASVPAAAVAVEMVPNPFMLIVALAGSGAALVCALISSRVSAGLRRSKLPPAASRPCLRPHPGIAS